VCSGSYDADDGPDHMQLPAMLFSALSQLSATVRSDGASVQPSHDCTHAQQPLELFGSRRVRAMPRHGISSNHGISGMLTVIHRSIQGMRERSLQRWPNARPRAMPANAATLFGLGSGCNCPTHRKIDKAKKPANPQHTLCLLRHTLCAPRHAEQQGKSAMGDCGSRECAEWAARLHV
jgi:hypothetical protein